MQDCQMEELGHGVFTISLDFELIWAALGWQRPDKLRAACEREHSVVIDRLLQLFVEFEIPATWCIVGHLFLSQCTPEDGRKHPEIVPPAHSWCHHSWFAHDPCTNEATDPIYYGRSLVDKIRSCVVPQEIGSHSFSHAIFGDPGCSRETVKSELAACVQLAREMGIELRSFAFPCNQIGYLDVIREFGFTCYRGREPYWYLQHGWPKVLERLAHLWDIFTAATPPVGLPELTDSGLWNIPGSMIYFPMHGLRRYVPMSVRVKRAMKGLDDAARRKRIFHLWFHPTNMADEMEAMFAGLRVICKHAAELRSKNQMKFLSMVALIPVLERNPGAFGAQTFERSHLEHASM